eukprot:663074_1
MSSSWSDLNPSTSMWYYGIKTDRFDDRYFLFFESARGCANDTAWFVVSGNTGCILEWNEGEVSPQIFYSRTNTVQTLTPSQEGEAMIMYLYFTSDSPTSPTIFLTLNPSSIPTIRIQPSVSPTIESTVPTTAPSLNGEVLIYENAGPIQAVQGQGNIGYYPVGNCMRFQFVVKFRSWCKDDWCSIFHGGDDSSSSAQGSQRMPGVWMHKGARASGKFHVVFTHVNSPNPTIDVGPSGGLALQMPYAFDISLTQSSLTVIINSEVVYNNQKYPRHCVSGDTCHGVRVGATSGPHQDWTPFQIGQRWYGALAGTVSDIMIYACGKDGEKMAREKAEKERKERERQEAIKREEARKRAEEERKRKERERKERERRERERKERERKERERKERKERERIERER